VSGRRRRRRRRKQNSDDAGFQSSSTEQQRSRTAELQKSQRTFLSGHLSMSVGSLNKQSSIRTEDAAFLEAAVGLIGCSPAGAPLDAFFSSLWVARVEKGPIQLGNRRRVNARPSQILPVTRYAADANLA
jgi:hypothetical protein